MSAWECVHALRCPYLRVHMYALYRKKTSERGFGNSTDKLQRLYYHVKSHNDKNFVMHWQRICESQVKPLLALKKDSVTRFSTNLFCLTDSTWAPFEQAETVWRSFSFFRMTFYSKNWKSRICVVASFSSQWLLWHGVCVVVDYVDMMSAWSLTTLTLCQCIHCVRAVLTIYSYNCADTRFLRTFAKIFAKTKHFAKPFLPVYKGSR